MIRPFLFTLATVALGAAITLAVSGVPPIF
jgi:hypothetical protein